jgi:hypothetical protein
LSETTHESNVGKWERFHGHVFPYGPLTTYQIGADWLSDQSEVADWGCGPGFFKTLLKPGIKYRGVDGSRGVNVDVIADLEIYRSQTSALFMRHVLEHNWNWKAILRNALDSFQNKFFLVLFIPLRDGPTANIRNDFRYAEVPDLSFNEREFLQLILDAGCAFERETIQTTTQYGVEVIFRITRKTP